MQGLLSYFSIHEIHHIDRIDNDIVDILSKLVESNKDELDTSVYFEELTIPTIEAHQLIEINASDETGMKLVIDYLKDGTLSENPIKAKQLRSQVEKYFIQEDTFYKRTFDSPILKWVDEDEVLYCMLEVHEGICGDHMGGKALAPKILRQGYFWPTLTKDCMTFVKKWAQCQLFSSVPKLDPALPSSILNPIPFAQWGIDTVDPLPKVKDILQYLMVAIGYMTKWAEAKVLRHITQDEVIKFV